MRSWVIWSRLKRRLDLVVSLVRLYQISQLLLNFLNCIFTENPSNSLIFNCSGNVNQVVCSLPIKAWVVAQFCNFDVFYIDTGICFIPDGTGTVRPLLVPTSMGVWGDFRMFSLTNSYAGKTPLNLDSNIMAPDTMEIINKTLDRDKN